MDRRAFSLAGAVRVVKKQAGGVTISVWSSHPSQLSYRSSSPVFCLLSITYKVTRSR
jgi:hypothetical protein